MAKSAKHGTPAPATEAGESAADVAVAIDKERKRLERRLKAASKKQAKRSRQLAAAEKSKDKKQVKRRRRQAVDATMKEAALTEKLALLAGSGSDGGPSAAKPRAPRTTPAATPAAEPRAPRTGAAAPATPHRTTTATSAAKPRATSAATPRPTTSSAKPKPAGTPPDAAGSDGAA